MTLLILDTTERPDIDDMILAHKHLGAGDVTSVWSLVSWNKLRLVLTITKPSRCVVMIEFDVPRQGGVVDQIVRGQGLYLQGGRPGDRLVTTFDSASRISVEVPSRDFQPTWDQILRKALFRDFRERGLSRSDAKNSVTGFLEKWRELTSMRMKSEYDQAPD